MSDDELERLQKSQLQGELLLLAVLHLEKCEICSKKLLPVSDEELLKAVFGDEPLPNLSNFYVRRCRKRVNT